MKLRDQIEKYIPYNTQEEKDKETFLRYLDSFDNYLERENEYGHLTSSAFVLNKERTKVIMIFHNIYNSWSWVGGHADGDEDLLHVALKETKEETGLKNVTPITEDIFIIDTLPVIGHPRKGKYVPAHVHLNVAYLLEADEKEPIRIQEDENSDIDWIPLEKMVDLSNEPFMQVVFEKGLEKMREMNYIK